VRHRSPLWTTRNYPDAALTAEDVTDYLRERLARYKVPKYVRFVDSIPINATGKIQRVELRRLANPQ
jgi:fatty-acyl-CoA synthase